MPDLGKYINLKGKTSAGRKIYNLQLPDQKMVSSTNLNKLRRSRAEFLKNNPEYRGKKTYIPEFQKPLAAFKAELADKKNIKIERSFEFEPGYYKEMWKNNVVIAGLAGSFLEPLEATSIGSTIQQMFILIHFLPADDRKSNNRQYSYLMENIFNFVALHYYVKKDSSDFWKHVSKDLPFTDFLKEYLPIWKTRLPQDGDFLGNWNMFRGENFIHILFGLGLFDLSAILKECNLHSSQEQQGFNALFEKHKKWERTCIKMSHKQCINLIKNSKEKVVKRSKIY